MSAPRHGVFPNDCLHCTLRRESDLCNLPGDLLGQFNQAGHLTVFPPEVTLVAEGQIPTGAYIICSGRAKFSVTARDGKTVILKVAGERHVVGLSAIVSGRPSPITVTTIDPCQIKFIDQESFLQLLQRDSHAAFSCAILLSREIQSTFGDVHDLLLARSSTEKLARLLLSWVAGQPHNQELRVDADFTHQEIAQMIGSSRETVTRLLSDMKRRELIRLEGSTLVIPNRIALQAVAS